MLLACGTASFHFPDLFFTPIALFQVGFSPAQASSSEGCGISDRRETERLTRAWVGIRFGMIASVDQLLGSTTMVFLGARTV